MCKKIITGKLKLGLEIGLELKIALRLVFRLTLLLIIKIGVRSDMNISIYSTPLFSYSINFNIIYNSIMSLFIDLSIISL